MLRWQRALLAVVAAGLVAALDAGLRKSAPGVAQAVWPTTAEPTGLQNWQPVGMGHIPMPADARAAHASYLLAMPKDHCTDSIGAQPEVQLVCQSPNVHLTVSGVARLMSPTASSELMLINLDPATGEYWDQMHYSHATLWRRS